MGRVTVHFSEDDYQLFHHYCANYCRLYDETRKNSIKILLELYKHQVIDIQEHSLDNIFTFFYQKKQEFETECIIPASNAEERMRIRICSDIISFLEDLEKIYRLLRKKNVEANYILLIGAFSKIFEEENRTRLEDLHETASGAIKAIVSPLAEAIEKKHGQESDTKTLLYELVSFAEIFNRLSPDLTFSDEVIVLLAPPLLKKFGKEESYEEIRTLLKDHRDQFEMDELESALEGGIHARNVWGLEFSWQEFLEPLRTLNELVAQNQDLMRVSLDVLSALEAPMKEKPAESEYSQLTLYQRPYGIVRRRNDENQILVSVDNRSRSEVRLSSVPDFSPPVHSQEQKYKQYFSVTAGALALLTIILAGVILSLLYPPPLPLGNTTGGLSGAKNGTIAASAAIKMNTPLPTLIPTPIPTPQYVTIEPVIRERETSPMSNRELFEKPAAPPKISFDSRDYLTIFKNNLSYNLANSYKISFDLKNPPMVIRYTVIPQNITDTKWFEPTDFQKKIDTAIINRPDEFAWFEMKIYENESLYDKQGWGGLYGIPLTMQETVIRNPGMYEIEFSGQEVAVSSEILVKKEGNIKSDTFIEKR
jgi:hypothetical protein